MHKKDVEEELEGKGDFIKIDYLSRYIKGGAPVEMKKFSYLKLADLYLERRMYPSAAESFRNAAINSFTFKEKQKHFLSESGAWILSFRFDEGDKALKRALDEANKKEKEEIYKEFTGFYAEEIEKFENMNKPGHLIKLYEKFMRLKIEDEKKEKVREKLLNLYEKMGMTKEYSLLESSGGRSFARKVLDYKV